MKKAYPNFEYDMNFAPSRDTQKWIDTVRQAYYMMHNGVERSQAFNKIISGWDKMEKIDFQNWLKFYEEGAQQKYKVAQVSYHQNAERPGYFIPMFHEPPQEVQRPLQDLNQIQDPSQHPDILAEEKREVIEEQRKKIIGRLDSAEKLLRSREGQLFAGHELEALLDIIYSLKKKIHMVNKISLSTRIYEDMIIREANILSFKGLDKASDVLIKIAQAVAQPAPPEPANPMSGGGLPGNLPGEGPGMTPQPEMELSDLPSGEISEGMKQFLEGLENGGTSFDDEELEVDDAEDNLEVFEADDLISSGQILPEAETFTKKMDQVFEKVTIEDVITEFEFIANFYKAREIPRRLAQADMMLDSLGLASFFDTLAEAQNKALESNNYISARVEEILSKLRGSVKTPSIELESNMEEVKNRPDVAPIKQNLQEQQNKEKARKEMRKELSNKEIDKPIPNVDVEGLASSVPTNPLV